MWIKKILNRFKKKPDQFNPTPAQHAAQLEDLAFRMRVLYTEVSVSDIIMVEDVARTLKERATYE
jgi:hypothetical protein